MTFQSFGMIFTISFITSLSGACSPGPLLVYTIFKSMGHRKHGYLMGLLIITGHAILEAIILALILAGFLFLLKLPYTILIISLAGCFFLIYFGISIFYNIRKGKINTDFLNPDKQEKKQNRIRAFHNPVLGGFIVSMSNPYWWIWWATIGAATLVEYDINMNRWQGVLAFFLGHEAGDFAWYIPISIIAFFGRKKINKKIYLIILALCAAFMIFFGIYLGFSALTG